jgi:hypothetical protein
VLGLALATGISWAGVRLVADEVAPVGSGPLSQAEVERLIHASGSSPVSPGAPVPSASAPPASSVSAPSVSAPSVSAPSAPPAAPASASAPTQTTVVARGGTVVVQCQGSVITARYSPAPGYSGRQETHADQGKIEVDFRSSTQRSKVEGSCREGRPVTTVEESDRAEDD